MIQASPINWGVLRNYLRLISVSKLSSSLKDSEFRCRFLIFLNDKSKVDSLTEMFVRFSLKGN